MNRRPPHLTARILCDDHIDRRTEEGKLPRTIFDGARQFLYDIRQLPQVVDRIVDPQIRRSRGIAWIEPATGKMGVVGAPDIRSQGISNYQNIIRRGPGDLGEHIVIVGAVRFGGPCFLGYESVRNQLSKNTALKAASLNGGHCVRDDIEPVATLHQQAADFFCMGQRVCTGSQGSQIIPVGRGGIPLQPQRLKEADEPLQRDEFLADLTTVKGVP